MDPMKETLADRSLNAEFFPETYNGTGKHIDFRMLSGFQILECGRLIFIWKTSDRVLLAVDLVLTNVDSKFIGDMDHFPHGFVTEIIGVIALLESAERNAENCTGHIFGDIAHEFEPDAF